MPECHLGLTFWQSGLFVPDSSDLANHHLFTILNIESVTSGTADATTRQVVDGITVGGAVDCRQGGDACGHIALGCQRKSANHAVAPFCSVGVCSDDVVALRSNVELKLLFGDASETVIDLIADVDGRRVGGAGYGRT